uniref:C2H2-type domain-containing protein n=1 Tax=Pygocentrus nattereri TaxID=42514 RepID=A0AAR2J591_PYGNA
SQVAHNQGESAVKPISKENGVQPNCTQTNGSDTLEIKISAQSLELNVGTKENNASHAQGTPLRAGKASASTHKETSAQKLIKCEACNKMFTYLNNLKRHQKTFHSGQTPHACKDCGERFGRVKAFCCEHCGKGFRRGTHLKTHLLTHTGVKPFECDLCPKKFTLKGSLKAHRLTHTGEKSFVCNICSKSFTQASSLGKHKRTHTGEKPYLCDFCNKSFCQSSHLHYHYRASHSGAKP